MGNKIDFAISPEELAPNDISKTSSNQIYFMDKHLTEIPKQILVLQTNLEKLFLNKNQIQSISDTINFSKFTKLTEISLANNLVKAIPPNFCFLPNLSILSLEHNKLNSLPSNFDSLQSLEELDLDFNYLDVLDLSQLANLSKCNCSNNQLIHLSFESVEYLDASCNDLSVLDTNGEYLIYLNLKLNLFAKWNYDFPCLDYLNLSYNLLEEMCEIKCKEIYLNHNRIVTFLVNETMQILELKNNRLKSLSSQVINNSLEILRLSNNQISDFSIPCKKLKILNLDHNDLQEFFYENSSIETLDLSYNRISKLLPIACLKRLNLCCNQLTYLPKEVLEIPNLIDLNVAMNLIIYIEVPSHCRISTLNLAFNQLKEIPQDFINLLEDIISIDVSWNQLKKLPKIEKFIGSFLCGGNILPPETIIPRAYETSENPFLIEHYHESISGFSELIGKRESFEDTHIICENFSGKMRIFALFDGHNGNEASKLAEKVYINLLSECLSMDHIKTLKDSIMVLEREIISKVKHDTGTTASVVLVDQKSIYTANVGDSRTILVTKDGVLELSRDHKPNIRQEYNAIRKRGGFVKDDRVNNILAISRTLGDQILKKYVSSEPYTCIIDIPEDSKFIVVGCDGVWDVLSNHQVASLIQNESHYDCNVLARKIRDCAYSLGSTDNITVIVIKI